MFHLVEHFNQHGCLHRAGGMIRHLLIDQQYLPGFQILEGDANTLFVPPVYFVLLF
jgi:hypothetical protein